MWGARGARWGVRHGRKCLRQVYGKLRTRELSPEVAEQSSIENVPCALPPLRWVAGLNLTYSVQRKDMGRAAPLAARPPRHPLPTQTLSFGW